jgi:hypothetical protein
VKCLYSLSTQSVVLAAGSFCHAQGRAELSPADLNLVPQDLTVDDVPISIKIPFTLFVNGNEGVAPNAGPSDHSTEQAICRYSICDSRKGIEQRKCSKAGPDPLSEKPLHRITRPALTMNGRQRIYSPLVRVLASGQATEQCHPSNQIRSSCGLHSGGGIWDKRAIGIPAPTYPKYPIMKTRWST